MKSSLETPSRLGARVRIGTVLFAAGVIVMTVGGAASAADAVDLSVAKGPGADDVTLDWTAGHGGPYTIFASTLPPPETLPGNAIGTTAGLSWVEATPVPAGDVLYFRVLGAGCLTGDECPSGFCSDGFCCNAACLGTCEACDLAGSEGTCTLISSGQDPDDECVSGSACDGFGACAPCPAETCNGLDDDCDGAVDNGDPGGGGSCNTGMQGVCAAGTLHCVSGNIVCQQNVTASPEVCDGLDNDCDGAVDDGNPGHGLVCSTGLPGVCAAGTTQCQSGTIVCEQNVASSAELCDGLDNDCDGAVDQGNPEGGAACNTGQPGVCAFGALTCLGATLMCVQNVPPSADLPDEGFVDSNCDGIDGDLSKAIFVSTTGSILNSGITPDSPVPTVSQGLSLASAVDRNQVLVAIGTYAEGSIALKDGVGIYGNYADPAYTTRTFSLTDTVVQSSSATAMTGVNLASPTDIQFLYVKSANASSVGESSYGIRATNGSGLRIRYSRIQAGAGAPGQPGGGTPTAASGGGGGIGNPGCENSTGLFCSTCSRPTGGSPGGSSCGSSGGRGGAAGLGSSSGLNGQNGSGGFSGGIGGPGTPGGHGNWNTPSSYWGQNGNPGTAGTNGLAGFAFYGSAGYSPQNGANGTPGGNGRGGGGGGGGGGGTTSCDSYGGGGGGGGGGGCGSAGASGGGSAGGSFAVYLWASDALISNSELWTASGGQGGNGGTSGFFGAGGPGGHGSLSGAGNNYGGSSEQDDGSNGGRGGSGGAGGRGGHGGGGAGGPSVGIVIGAGSSPSILGVTFVLAPGGSGGSSSGNPGPNGVSSASVVP